MMIIFLSLLSCVRHILGQTLFKFKSRSHIFFYAQKSSLIEFKLFRTWWTPPVLTHRRQHRDCNLNILSFSTRHLPGEKQSPHALSITPYQSQSQYRIHLNKWTILTPILVLRLHSGQIKAEPGNPWGGSDYPGGPGGRLSSWASSLSKYHQ